jgi:hypothetical protein
VHVFEIAYCEESDTLAISLFQHHTVVFLDYASGSVKSGATIGNGWPGRADGQLYYPDGLAFSDDGRFLFVADKYNHRISKFVSATGAFVEHLLTRETHGIEQPSRVVQYGDCIRPKPMET